jgi:hypothetical protein
MEQSNLAAGKVLQAAPGLEIKKAGGESLVHDPATGKVHVLNDTAARVLGMCDGTHTLGSIVEHLVATTNVERERATADVSAVCDNFRANGLIT